MDQIFLCPDCRSEHAEPYEAVLGHLARCEGCALLLDLITEGPALDVRFIEIRVAA